ncbi:hypothetical protein ABFT23_01210 [Nocardioides sp. C4-1]|uniref:hypothetical protein n=1 Tax=Nocardioides sp. C4-1 TaxID=3151851 RepID=UPI0032666FD9
MGGGMRERSNRSTSSIGRVLALLQRMVASLATARRRPWFAAVRPVQPGRDTVVPIRVHRPARPELRTYSVVRC